MTGTLEIDDVFIPQGGEAQFIAALRGNGVCVFDEGLSKADRILRGRVLSTLLRGDTLQGWDAIKRPKEIFIYNACIEGELNLKYEVCPFALSIMQSEFTHKPDLSLATFMRLSLQNSVLPGLEITSATIKSDFILIDTNFTSGFDATTIQVEGAMIAGKARFSSENRYAVSLEYAEIGKGLFFNGAHICGMASLSGVSVGGQVSFEKASLQSLNNKSLMLQDAKIETGLILQEFPHPPIGAVNLGSAKINAIQLDKSFWPIGGVNFSDLTYTRIVYPDGLKRNEVWQGWLDRQYSAMSVDGKKAWHCVRHSLDRHFESNDQLEIKQKESSLVIYKSEYCDVSVKERNDVVAKVISFLNTTPELVPQPWRQYAKVLDAAGNEIEARRVRTELAKRMTRLNVDRMKVHKASRSKIWPYLVWRFIFSKVSDYGLMPVKSLYWGVGLLVFGWIIFYLNYSDMVLARERVYMLDAYSNYKHGNPLPEGYPNFNPFIYALDVMLPIVDFAQESHWRPKNVEDGVNWLRWYNRAHLALGWFLSTIFVLGFTGLIRDKKEP